MSSPTGIDVSSHNPGIDWAAAAKAGLDFAFIKRSQGTGYLNPLFAAQWAGAKAAGVLRSAYHFFTWDTDPVAQARYFLQALGPDRGELPCTVDVENTGDGAGQGPKDPAKVRAYVDEIKRQTGRAPIIYTYPSMWHDTLGNPQTFTDCPLWLASYGAIGGAVPRPVGGWSALTFWQTTDRAAVAGVPGLVDADVFVGSLADLRAFAGLTTKPDAQFFPQTGHWLAHGFLALWNQYGLAVCGYPLSEEYAGHDGATYQDCENVMFRYTPTDGARIAAGIRLLKYGS